MEVEPVQLSLLEFKDRAPKQKFNNIARLALFDRYADKICENSDLDRTLISFQANKRTPFYRWFKYKEAFSSEFIQYILNNFRQNDIEFPHVLDPFSGAGTALTTAAKLGWRATGIELLPLGDVLVKSRQIGEIVNKDYFRNSLKQLSQISFDNIKTSYSFPHIRITSNAFPNKTERDMGGYLDFVQKIKDNNTQFLFWFACLCILEEISYTSKDGQYLRWDARSGKCMQSKLNKGILIDFKTAIINKLENILVDLEKRCFRKDNQRSIGIKVIKGSCLTELPEMIENQFNLIITSPPYCNRYDYTRTYALELAFLGYNEEAVKTLRQTLLSATVENRTKKDQLAKQYHLRGQSERFASIVEAFDSQEALNEVLEILYEAREKGKLNNNNIPNMIENYFFEMNLVIHELSRVLAPGGSFVMVNDNVQYYGEEIPVDLILSDFAEHSGLLVDKIWVLPKGKGNSSQQMGIHGRNEIRKCIYIWFKPEKKEGF